MKRFIKYYHWLIPSLLFALALIVIRMFVFGQQLYFWMGWNLLLAGLPLFFSFRARFASRRLTFFAWSAAWLLFFPNSMYITTDLFHLGENPLVPKWFDLVLITSAAINGLLYGVISLKNIETRLRDMLPAKYMNLVLLTLMMLCGYGIHLGRFLRWNSWDIVTNPLSLAHDIALHVIHPFQHAHIWVITATFGTWMYLLYKFLRRLEKR